MESILFIAHGSKKTQCNRETENFVSMLKKVVTPKKIELCYLEFAHPSIQEGISNCAKKGSTKIIAMPLLLSDASHAKEDIPNEIDRAKLKYPQIEFYYGKPIGVHRKIYDILLTRLFETKCSIDKKTAVIIVAKGSRVDTANSNLIKISKEFSTYCEAGIVAAAFLNMASPKFEDVIEECIDKGASKFVILPYILFQGLLIKKIDETINEFVTKYPDYSFLTGKSIGSHLLLFEIIKERIEEALECTEVHL